MLTAMIWRMERRTVVAAMVGGNCNIDETFDAISAVTTIQSSALVPVLRLIALRAMKDASVQRDWKRKYSRVFFYVIQSSSNHNLRAVKAGFKGQAPWFGRPDNGMGIVLFWFGLKL